MAYVPVKGGEEAIANAQHLIAEDRRGDAGVPALGIDQIQQQFGRAVDRVMAEGSLYDPELAALALKQAQGDVTEAVFPVARLSHHAGAVWPRCAGGHRSHGDPPPYLGHL